MHLRHIVQRVLINFLRLCLFGFQRCPESTIHIIGIFRYTGKFIELCTAQNICTFCRISARSNGTKCRCQLVVVRIDRLILRLKQQYLLSDIRFVREYGNERVETPIRGLLAVISVVSTARDRGYLGGFLSSTVRGETYGAKLEIRVYAPACENGNGLSEIVGDILSGLERADDEKIITSASATSIEFDPNMNAIYITVQISIEFCVCEED